MLSINGKKFMNISEAVQWLLDNNALPFQCKANFVADTIISFSEIINPSPVEVKVGSLVLFADLKVGTVTGVSSTGFMVGQDYSDFDQLNQIVSIALDASNHLIVTMSNGDTIDAGLLKELSAISIDGSQHIIATYNDGTTTDLGDIFQNDITITGNLTVTGKVIGKTEMEKVVDGSGNNRFIEAAITAHSSCPFTFTYARWSLSGTHLMIVLAGTIPAGTTLADGTPITNAISVPQWVLDKIYPVSSNTVENRAVSAYKVGAPWVSENLKLALNKGTDLRVSNISGSQVFSNDDAFRIQFDLLIDND